MKLKGIKRRITNIVLLGVLLLIVIGAYFNVYNSKAEEIVEIPMIVLDEYGLLENEETVIEAKLNEDGDYVIELPESINTKKVHQYYEISLEDLNNPVEETTQILIQNTAGEDTETTVENTETTVEDTTGGEATEETVENETETNTSEDTDGAAENTETGTTDNIVDETTEENVVEETTQETVEDTQQEENSTENSTTVDNKIILTAVDNKITLTAEQIEGKRINIKVVYDITILTENENGEIEKTVLSEKTEEELQEIEITEETEMLYEKVLKYEDEENAKMVEVRGKLPIDAELKIIEVGLTEVKEMVGDEDVKIAYDITIRIPTTNEDGTIEYTNVNPKDFDETCEVSIKDEEINMLSQVYHIKDDKTVEQVEIKESDEGIITFETDEFSIYAVATASDEDLMASAISSQSFSCTKAVQTYTAPYTGTYTLEVAGAQGGTATRTNYTYTGGAKGGYATGNVHLTKGQVLYIYVGEQGGNSAGGWNGGGAGSSTYVDNQAGDPGMHTTKSGGGGATHIASASRGVLSSYSSYKSEIYLVGAGRRWMLQRRTLGLL